MSVSTLRALPRAARERGWTKGTHVDDSLDDPARPRLLPNWRREPSGLLPALGIRLWPLTHPHSLTLAVLPHAKPQTGVPNLSLPTAAAAGATAVERRPKHARDVPLPQVAVGPELSAGVGEPSG